MATWHDAESIRDEWDDAPDNDARLESLLDVSKAKVIAYAPRLVEDATVPQTYREAQLRVVINLWNDEEADAIAVDPEYPVARRYLEWKKLVRPGRGVPRVR